jgi:hypothetical protein
LESNFNGGHFCEKNSKVFKLGPQSVGRFHQMGACQAAEKKIFILNLKSKIQKSNFTQKNAIKNNFSFLKLSLSSKFQLNPM